MKSHRIVVLGLAVMAGTTLHALEITLPQETARLKESPLPGYTLTTALCYTCHSADYVQFQPPMSSRAYWKATVVKMQKTFGAPIPEETVEPIVDYLVKTYGAERPAATTDQKGAAATQPGSGQKK